MKEKVITKSDLLLYCEAPLHLWAKKNNKIVQQLSEFDQYLIKQGYEVESLAREFLETIILPQNPNQEIQWQVTYSDGSYEARVDALLFKPNLNSYDLYEIKSSTGVDNDDVYDVTYQALILNRHIVVDHFNILHLNKDYIRNEELDLSLLFMFDDITEKVNKLKPEVMNLREKALLVSQTTNTDGIEHCLNPKTCPCPEVCHPNLPEFSIYDIPYLSKKKKQQLLDDGICVARDIPDTFDLNEKQRLIVGLAKTNLEHIDHKSLQSELEKIVFPVYFLDYETCITAIPKYQGYHPQQQIVFQYSLHKMEKLDGEVTHTDYLSTNDQEPSLSLVEKLSMDIGSTGSVIVWNKTFEMTMNKEMAKIHPKYEESLDQLNQRIYDLGDVVNQGYYLHPGFKGSWSIKNVLPMMVPELCYKELEINKGDQASVTWLKICFGQISESEKLHLIESMLCYCKMDTLAMVEIFKVFRSIL